MYVIPLTKSGAIRNDTNTSQRDPTLISTGVDFNDYEMIKCYNGFKMIDSRSELELLDVPEISSVYELVKRIEG